MSEAFVDVIDRLREAEPVEFAAASTLVYLVDGGMPRMPIAQRIPKAGYTKPHWAPVVLNPTSKAAPVSRDEVRAELRAQAAR